MPEVVVVAALASLDSTPSVRGQRDVLWLVLRRGNLVALVPIHRGVLPIVGAGLRTVVDDAVRTLFREQSRRNVMATEPVVAGRRYSIYDDERALEKLTIGHFKPARTPGGMEVEAAEFWLRDPPR